MNTSGFIFFEDELLNGGSVMTRNVDFPEFETVSIKVAKIIGLLLLDFLLEVSNEKALANADWEGRRLTLNKAEDGDGVAH